MSNKSSDRLSLKEGIGLNLRAFRMWYKQYPKIFLSAAACETVKALTPYAGIYLSAQIINELAGARSPERLWRLVWISLAAAALLGLLNAALLRYKKCTQSAYYYNRAKFYSDKMLDLDFCSLDEQHTHELRSQIRQNENWTEWGLGRVLGYFETILKSLAGIIGAVLLTVSLFTQRVPDSAGRLTELNHPAFMLLIAAGLLFCTLLAPICANRAESYWTRDSEEAKRLNRLFGFFCFLAFNNRRAPDIRLYRQEIISRNYYRGLTLRQQIEKYALGPMGAWGALSASISAVFTGAVYVFVCLKSWAGAFGVGSVTQYIGAVTALSSGLASLISVVGNMRSNAVFLKTTFEFLDIPNTMYQGSLTTEKRSDRNYEVEFRNVSFKYPNRETYALRNVSIKFKVGRRLAVVGQNGSGKTTFIKLLCRLYDPTEGEILLNGINIRKYQYDEYMSIFSVVFQDFKLFSFPLGQNVAARMDYSKEMAETCLEEAGFGRRLSEMPAGLETGLYKDFDQNGVEISGGEAQKIAIARALYKDAPFIILDEPTAALDPIAEYEIYSKFNEIIEDKTAIYISHRLSSCRFCDDIAVFDNGEIVQYGSHESLVDDGSGKYHELWHAQAQYYTADAT